MARRRAPAEPAPEAVTYRVRIDLRDTKPPLWRRLELAADLRLDQVHDVIQMAFGWTDSHLHRFASGPARYSTEAERYLCPSDVAEGDTGIPESTVRLDEVLAKPGDKLFYTYVAAVAAKPPTNRTRPSPGCSPPRAGGSLTAGR